MHQAVVGLSSLDLAAAGLGAAGAIALTLATYTPPRDARCRADATTSNARSEARPHDGRRRTGDHRPAPRDASRADRGASEPTSDERTIHECATGRDWAACDFLDPGEAELAEMARCGVVRFDFPDTLCWPDRDVALPEAWVTTLDLSEDERQAVREVTASFRDALWDDLTAMAEGTDLEPDWIAQTDLLTVAGRLEMQDLDADEDAFVRVARQRAGLEPSPSEPTMHDRLADRLADLGDDFETALAEHLGAARARELRVAGDGWDVRMRLRKRCLEETSR